MAFRAGDRVGPAWVVIIEGASLPGSGPHAGPPAPRPRQCGTGASGSSTWKALPWPTVDST